MYERHIVIDLEFTPIPQKCTEQREIAKNEIIQIGAVLLDSNYRKISTFSTYVKPEYATHIKPSVSKLTGITDKDLENAPSLKEAVEKMTVWIGSDKRTRVYSWSDTDLYQLEDECYLKGIPFPENMRRWMDFQAVWSRLLCTRQKLSLKNAVTSANGQFMGTQAHTALYDAMATAELLIMATAKKEEFEEKTRGIRALLAPPKKCCTTIGEIYGAQLAKFLA